ncbi:MAG: esterase/lipase family protein [Myxococcota bacterium]
MPAALVVVALGVTAAAFVPLLADRGKPAQPGRKELGTLSREALGKVLFWSTGFLGWFQGQPRSWPAHPDRNVPVLLVADTHHGRHAMFALAWFLRRRGHGTVWAVGTGRGGLSDRAATVEGYAARLLADTGSSQIDIVAHGIGGLVAGWYVSHLGGKAHVRHQVTMGTPWHGTRMAAFSRAPLASETLPNAPLLDGLRPPQVPLTCIWGSMDPMVLPRESAFVDGATSVRLSGAGHLDLLLSARAFRAVDAALTGAGPTDPEHKPDVDGKAEPSTEVAG